MDTLTQFGVYLLLSLPLIGAYAMLAVGIVVIFRASKVLNLAHGAMALLPAYLVYSLHQHGVPVLVSLVLGVVSGAVLGALVERLFVRPLAAQGPTAQTVGTVAVYGLVVAAVAQAYGSGSRTAPEVFPHGGLTVAGAPLRWGQLGLFAVALLAAAGFVALFRYTRVGLTMRGAAENPAAAGLMGIDPDRMARLAWSLGGGLAGLAGALLASVTNLNPYSLSLQMLPAFVAALIGGLASVPGALVGAAIVGAAQGLVPAFSLIPGLGGVASQVGMPQLVLTLLAFVVMFLRGQRFSLAGGAGLAAAAARPGRPRSAFDQTLTAPRRGGRRVWAFVLLAGLVVWPFLNLPDFLPLTQFALLGDANQLGVYFLVAASIVLLTGWVGQISLAQASFVGIGAIGTAQVAEHVALPFPLTLVVAALMAGAISLVLGLIALRVRGLYLAVATLIFAWMADNYLFVVPWFASAGGSSTLSSKPIGVANTFPFFDLTERRTFYFVLLAVASAVFFAMLNLRDSKTGRAFSAVRGSEVAAASLGIDVVRTKLFAFTLAGAVAGIAGNLIITNQVTVVADAFNLQISLLYLAIAVVGGLRSLGGAIAASAVFAALHEVFFQVPTLGRYLQLVSTLLLAAILLFYPGGMAALPATVERLRARLGGLPWLMEVVRLPARLAGTRADGTRGPLAVVPAALARFGAAARALAIRVGSALRHLPGAGRLVAAVAPRTIAGDRVTGLVVGANDLGATVGEPVLPPDPAAETTQELTPVATVLTLPTATRRLVVARDTPAMQATGITVRFGGLTAVNDASLRVEAGQIVGLIGPNGAGKTTLFNAISGLNAPTAGTVSLFGEDVTALPVHARAARGLGRTFQVIQLFPDLTVFENLMVATHLHSGHGPLSHIVARAGSVRAEIAAEETCRRVVRFLDLTDIADRAVDGLPFGTLRMIELARALVTGAPLVMLDEPASGLDNRETDRLSEVLGQVRDALGLSVLLIEHDVRMVTAVSDYMYVLDRGTLIAQGRPAQVQRHPEVIRAYLGEPLAAEVAS